MNNKRIILLVILIIVALAFTLGGHTYAKYITRVKGEGKIDVAKWNFKVNNNSEQIETITLAKTINQELLKNGKIAPGTGGEFSLIIDGSGTEVGIDYKVEVKNERNKPTNLIYTYNDKKYNSLVEISEELSGEILANDNNKIRNITIFWNWEYETGNKEEIENNDEIDTKEGIANLDYTFDIAITGKQKAIE